MSQSSIKKIAKTECNIENKIENKNSEKIMKKHSIFLRIQIVLTLVFFLMGALLFALIKSIPTMHITRGYYPLVAFPFYGFIVFYLFPKKLKIPFGEISLKEFNQRLGLSTPNKLGMTILLGIILGLCTLSGMLIGSLLIGHYVFDLHNLTIDQILFSTVPAIWEEIFFRGIFMILLLKLIKNLKIAIIFQCIMFGLFHLKGFDFWTLFDIISVILMAIIFSYSAHKTNSLIPGIIFHYIHDAFLYLVQLPDGIYNGTYENLVFYLSLSLSLIVGWMVIKVFTDKFNVKQSEQLYDLKKIIELEQTSKEQ